MANFLFPMSPGWLSRADQWLGHYPHVISALGSFSTSAAVIVSLLLALLAHRSNRTRLRASAGLSELVRGTIDLDNRVFYLGVELTNIGRVPAYVPAAFFHFQAPFQRARMVVLSPDIMGEDPSILRHQYPYKLEPGASETFYIISWASLRGNIARTSAELPAWQRPTFRFTRAYVTTQDGTRFKVKMAAAVRRLFKS